MPRTGSAYPLRSAPNRVPAMMRGGTATVRTATPAAHLGQGGGAPRFAAGALEPGHDGHEYRTDHEEVSMGNEARVGLLLGATCCLLAVMVDWLVEELHGEG